MNGDQFNADRRGIKIIKWKNYNINDYDAGDIELFTKIDPLNYIKEHTKERVILNEKFEYEFMVIKNYKKYLEEIFTKNDPNHEYIKLPIQLKQVSETKAFKPDFDISIQKIIPEAPMDIPNKSSEDDDMYLEEPQKVRKTAQKKQKSVPKIIKSKKNLKNDNIESDNSGEDENEKVDDSFYPIKEIFKKMVLDNSVEIIFIIHIDYIHQEF